MAFGVAIAAVWIYLLVGRGGFWRMNVKPAAPSAAEPPRVVAVVPARNEAGVVARAVASLAQQEYAGSFHIVLVDDHSQDATAAEARAAAPPERLTVLSARPLETGWTGKLAAVSEGVRHARQFAPEYLWLTDADIVHAPGTLAALTSRAREGYALVSYMATLRCHSLAERALVPAFVFFFFMLYPPAWGTGAAGGCMLIRREILEKIGGIAAIRSQLIDDCALAAAVRRAGGTVWLGPAAGTRSIRAYGTFAEIERMIARSAFAQLRHSSWLLAGTAAAMLAVFVAPVALACAGSWWGALAWALMSLMYLPVLRFYRVSPLWAPLLPAIATFYLAATFDSAVRHWRGQGGLWKGRLQG